MLFAETGLLVGFFLPGDSLLFTAGLPCTTGASGGRLSLPGVLAAAVAGALLNRTRNRHLLRLIGGLVWTVGLVLAGYALGSSITGVDRYLLPLVGAIVAVSLLPLALEILRSRTATSSAQRQAHR
ncbi:hypothetical protein [Nonomuraea sp. NPDC049784]|uniref:hypothetical protein n=1 Tax=Nonomuraea sp. NPDC049784 TaxID=3154361 RepID=UPI0033DA158C